MPFTARLLDGRPVFRCWRALVEFGTAWAGLRLNPFIRHFATVRSAQREARGGEIGKFPRHGSRIGRLVAGCLLPQRAAALRTQAQAPRRVAARSALPALPPGPRSAPPWLPKKTGCCWSHNGGVAPGLTRTREEPPICPRRRSQLLASLHRTAPVARPPPQARRASSRRWLLVANGGNL